ncbi:uncharacterized protein G2W53_032537 [Senna tora]|uniref:Uncharacterized protein n=1 Tax=Senna tora TaxID=362788 RepID=A0A834SZ98_9FABA|nr:uncharacterized protein G2W53_032537 [Senna tora]
MTAFSLVFLLASFIAEILSCFSFLISTLNDSMTLVNPHMSYYKQSHGIRDVGHKGEESTLLEFSTLHHCLAPFHNLPCLIVFWFSCFWLLLQLERKDRKTKLLQLGGPEEYAKIAASDGWTNQKEKPGKIIASPTGVLATVWGF